MPSLACSTMASFTSSMSSSKLGLVITENVTDCGRGTKLVLTGSSLGSGAAIEAFSDYRAILMVSANKLMRPKLLRAEHSA